MIAPPHTYFDWMNILKIFRSGSDDDGVLQAMLQGTISWQSGVAERFIQNLADSVQERLNLASDRFTQELKRAYGQERIIVSALLRLRREFRFLLQAVNLPAIPREERSQLCQLVKDDAASVQSSLEKSAQADRSGKLASIIKNNRIDLL